jgi:hypothetical protein
MTADPLAYLRIAHTVAEVVARRAAEPEEWMESRQPRYEWYVQHWADPDVTAIVADPESSAYPVATTTEGMKQADAHAQAAHIARWDPAAILQRITAELALLDDLLAEKHLVIEGDCWYTCRAATEEHDGGQNCNDGERGMPCDCGRDDRVNRRVRIMAEGWGWTPASQPRGLSGDKRTMTGMTLGELISALEAADPHVLLPIGFSNPTRTAATTWTWRSSPRRTSQSMRCLPTPEQPSVPPTRATRAATTPWMSGRNAGSPKRDTKGKASVRSC